MWLNTAVSHVDKQAISSLFSWQNQSYLLVSGIDLYSYGGLTPPEPGQARGSELSTSLSSHPLPSPAAPQTLDLPLPFFFAFLCRSCWRDVKYVNASEAALAPLHWLSPLPCSSSSSSSSSALRHHSWPSQMTQVGSRSLWANQGVRCSGWFTIQQQSSSDGFFVARVWAEPGDLPWKVRRRWTCFPRSRNNLSEILCCWKTMTSSCHDLVCTKDLPHCKDQHFIAIGKCAIMICVKVMYFYVKSAKWGNQRWNNFSLSLVFALCDSAGTPSVTLRRLH